MKKYNKSGFKISLPDWVTITQDIPLLNAEDSSDQTKGVIIEIYKNRELHKQKVSRLQFFQPMKNHPLLEINVLKKSETTFPFCGFECLQRISNTRTKELSILWEGAVEVKEGVYLSWNINDYGDFEQISLLWQSVIESMQCDENLDVYDWFAN